MRTRGIKVGDTITFTCTTRGSGTRKAKRKVVAIRQDEIGDWRMGTRTWIGVRYDGWNPFWLGAYKTDQIHSVEKAPKGVK